MHSETEELKKNLEIIVPKEGLEEKLKAKKKLRVKFGFDPTAPDLHLGHAVALKKLRQFQEFGHTIVIIIGDFTACIGDPTGRNKTRPPLTREDVEANAKTYLDQLSKILDLSKTEIHFNSKWFDKLEMRELIKLVSTMTLSQILQREDFKNRYETNTPIHFHELLYPIVQGYDSFMIESDIEMGGTDQLFNCLVGRDIQSAYGQSSQIVTCVSILKGLDGHQKMSKSLQNYVGLTEEPENMYGKLMSIPDNLIEEYATLISTFPEEKLKEIQEILKGGKTNPMLLKKELAYNIVTQFHNEEAAKRGAEHFYKQVQSRDEAIIEYKDVSLSSLGLKMEGLTLVNLCATLVPDRSKSDMRRLIEGGGVTLNSEKVTNASLLLQELAASELKLKIGKRDFFKLSV